MNTSKDPKPTDIWKHNPNQYPLFGYWKRRTFWQWLTRKPRIWIPGLISDMMPKQTRNAIIEWWGDYR